MHQLCLLSRWSQTQLFVVVCHYIQEGKTPVNAKQRIGYVVGHELAHQWFGNLVTMEWWSQLWLNEGFATWVGWRAMGKDVTSLSPFIVGVSFS